MLTVLMLVVVSLITACGGDQGNDQADTNGDQDTLWSAIEEKGEIVVGTSGTLYPASFYPEDAGEITGYDVEVIREVAQRLDLDIKFEELGIDSLFTALNSGRVDLVINDIEVTEERKEKFAFSTPYKYSYTTMIVREENLSGIHTLEDLEGKKAGGGATTVFSDIARHFGAEVVTYGNATNDIYLRDVDNGRTDVIINDYYLQTLALEFFPEFDITIHPDLQFHPTEQAILLPKEATTLEEKVNATLEEMRQDGTLTELSQQFFGGQDASKKPEKEVIEIEGLEL